MPQMNLPDDLKKLLRASMLSGIGSNPLDLFEMELFEWYEKETEVILSEMLAAELSYIRQQQSTNEDGSNDSGVIAVAYFEKRVRYSHVIYLTSLLETSLERACSVLITAVGHETRPFGPNELKGDQWQKTTRFLNRYGGFEFPGDLWGELKMLIAIRNCLVHENGSASNISRVKLKAMLDYPGLSVENSELVIRPSYIQYAATSVKSFLRELERRIRKVLEPAE